MDKYNKKLSGAVGIYFVLGFGSEECVGGNLPRRDGVVGFLEQTEGCFRVVISGFVDGTVEQDEVSPVASDVEVLNGNKGDGLDSESRRERGLHHFCLLGVVGVGNVLLSIYML